MIGGLLDQCKSDVYAIINLSASISTPETFLNTKAKCPLDVSEAVPLRVCGYLEQKLSIFATGKPPNTDYKPEGQ